jgi:hypothetical protein
MTESPFALSFVDHGRGVYGTARADFALMFEGGQAASFDEPSTIEETADGWNAQLPGGLSAVFTRVADRVELGGMRAHLCRVAGEQLDGLGVVSEIRDAPRYVSALFDPDNAVLAFARRPAGSLGHGQELVVAHLWSDGVLKGVEDARLSTIYDGEGRPRQSSMELWLPGEDFPRRTFGRVTAGASLALEGLDVHAAVMTWSMEGREGAGLYELTVREPAPAAA